MKRSSKRLLPWFGSNTENASRVGELLRGCSWVGIPFCGGLPEALEIDARVIVANDLHAHVVNLCWVIGSDEYREWMAIDAGRYPYHPGVLASAQRKALEFQERLRSGETVKPSYAAAFAYFVAVWMGRGGKAGTKSELSGELPVRWTASGGGSNQRYRTAIESLEDFGRAFRRCEFTCLDAFEFLANCRERDRPEHGIYVDAPWPDAGDDYLHAFTEDDQRLLAKVMHEFSRARIVIRYGDHPLIRELYSADTWTIEECESRNQANNKQPELLISRRGR